MEFAAANSIWQISPYQGPKIYPIRSALAERPIKSRTAWAGE